MRRRHLLAALAVLALVPFLATDSLAKKGGNKPPPEPADPAIAYVGGKGLMVMDADGANSTLVRRSSGNGFFFPSWSPDGAHIAYQRYSTWLEMWRVDVDGGNATLLVTDSVVSSPAWSPQGDEIAYIDIDRREIRTIPAGGGTPRTVYTASGTRRLHDLSYRSDGSALAFVEGLGHGEVKVLDLVSGVATSLHVVSPDDHWEHLDWARTQDVLAFRQMPSGRICTYDMLDGTRTEHFLGRDPSWSPDDSQLVYISGLELRVHTLATGEDERLIRRAGVHPAPDWKR